MLAEDLAAQTRRKLGHAVRLTAHVSVYGRRLTDDDCDFAVMISQLRAVVQVGGTTNNNSVVGNEELPKLDY